MWFPQRRARSDARWITGPSAIGSEKGTPSSIKSAPPRSSASTRSTVNSGLGSPPVRYAMNALRSSRLAGLEQPFRSVSPWPPASDVQLRHIFAIDVDVFIAASRNVHEIDLRAFTRARAESLPPRHAQIRAPE